MAISRTTICDAWLRAAPDDPVWRRRALVLIFSVALVRLACLALVPMALVPDEAYYWDWSRRLAWCYYSKPPMVAWLIALSTRLFGSHPPTVRLPAALLNIATLTLVYALGRAMFSRVVGFLAAFIFAIVPATVFLGLFMTIDAPLIACWIAALLCAWHALASGRLAWWCLAGCAAAAGVLTKQMMLVFPLVTFLMLAAIPAYRRECARPGVYIMTAVTLTALAPILLWNARHGWVTWQHTTEHFRGGRAWYAAFQTLGHFIGTQMAMISPLLWLLFMFLGVAVLRQWRRTDPRVRLLVVYSILPLAAVSILSLRQRILPNWPAVFYLAGSVLAAAWIGGAYQPGGDVAARLRRWLRLAVGIAVVEALAAVAALVLIGSTGMGERLIGKELRGWPELGQHVDQALRALPNPPRTMVMTFDRGLTAELAFYMPGRPRVYHWTLDTVILSQYGLWMNEDFEKCGWDALIVAPAARTLPYETNRFADCVFLADAPVAGGRRTYRLYHASNLRTWPKLLYRRSHQPGMP